MNERTLSEWREHAYRVERVLVKRDAEIISLRHELAEAKEELAHRREHMRRGIEPGRATGGEG